MLSEFVLDQQKYCILSRVKQDWIERWSVWLVFEKSVRLMKSQFVLSVSLTVATFDCTSASVNSN